MSSALFRLPALFFASLLVAAMPARGVEGEADDPALSSWFMPAEFDSPRLSPRGDFMAFILCDGKDYAIGIFDLSSHKLSIVEGTGGKLRPVGLWWKGPRRLLTHLVSTDGRSRIYSAFDIDGKNPERLNHLTERSGRIIDALADDPDHVLLTHGGTIFIGASVSVQSGEVVRFNIHNGKVATVGGDLPGVRSWYLDRGLNIRAAYRPLSDGSRIINWRNSGTGPWQSLKFAPTDGGVRPVGFDADPRYLWVWDYRQSAVTSLSRFDTQNGELTTGVGLIDGLEPTAVIVLGNAREPVAAVYSHSTPARIEPLNESWRPAIERMMKVFAGYNPYIVDKVAEGDLWIVKAGNSRFPGGYFLFNSRTGETTLIATAYNPALKEALFVAATPVKVPSRHGQTIRGRIWLPKDVKNPPVIVYCPESLPSMPADDLFNPYTQAYVRHGYAVVEFDGRGTMGYGRDFELLLQGSPAAILREDLEDGVRGLAAQGLVDERRAVLLGYGIGGALALSVAEHSALFRAAVSLNAPVEVRQEDLSALTQTLSLRSLSQHLGWRNSIKLIEALSPIDVAPRLKQPSLHLMDEARWNPGKFSDDAKRLQKVLRNNPQAKVGLAYSWFEGFTPPETYGRDRASAVDRIVKFCNQTLAAAP
jgi:hypothetical protein